MSDLHDRAKSAGLIRDWQDAKGTDQQVSDEALELNSLHSSRPAIIAWNRANAN